MSGRYSGLTTARVPISPTAAESDAMEVRLEMA